MLRGWLTEISLLDPSREPAHPRARLVWLEPVVASSPAAVTTSSNRAAAGKSSDEYRPPVWDELERIVGYRITDENQVQAFLEANRTPLEKLYDEHIAAKRATSGPQVLIRPGIGQVLGVR